MPIADEDEDGAGSETGNDMIGIDSEVLIGIGAGTSVVSGSLAVGVVAVGDGPVLESIAEGGL